MADELSWQKRLLFTALMCLALLFTLDTASYLALRWLGKKHVIFYEIRPPSAREVKEFFARSYHPRWGWDIPHDLQSGMGTRRGREYRPRSVYEIKAFGDSFTYGDEVSDRETYCYLIEAKTGWDCLNFGVLAFGPDQALLKYVDTEVRSKYAVLGILDENIARVVTNWWGFYNNLGFSPTKPRFLRHGLEFVLLPNPASDSAELRRLAERHHLASLAQYDYWHRYYERINAPPALRWPAIATLVPHAGFFAREFAVRLRHRLAPTYENAIRLRRYYHLYEGNTEALAILCHIAKMFIDTARNRGETPVILLFPTRDTMNIVRAFGKKPYQPLVDYLVDISADFLDFGDIFADEAFENYYAAHGHFSGVGNEQIANRLIDFLKRLGRSR